MAQGFAAGGALLGADELRAQPMASGFTTWIDALNGGARHEGHNALSPWRPAHPLGGELPLAAKSVPGRNENLCGIVTRL